MRSNLNFNLWDNISNPYSPVVYQIVQPTGNAPTLMKTKFFIDLEAILVRYSVSPNKRKRDCVAAKEGVEQGSLQCTNAICWLH